MEPVCIGEYVLKASLIEYYRLQTIDPQTKLITVYLKSGDVIKATIDDEDELERIISDLHRVLTEDK